VKASSNKPAVIGSFHRTDTLDVQKNEVEKSATRGRRVHAEDRRSNATCPR